MSCIGNCRPWQAVFKNYFFKQKDKDYFTSYLTFVVTIFQERHTV